MTPDDTTFLKALSDGVTHVAQEAEAKWGVDRLRLLVSDDLRLKFDRQAEKYEAALRTCWGSGERPLLKIDVEGAREAAERMRRAWATLDKRATESGCTALSASVWEVATHDGQVIAFCRDVASAHAVRREGRAMSVWTPAEIANLIAALPELIGQAKESFPGACVVAPDARRTKFKPDESIPF